MDQESGGSRNGTTGTSWLNIASGSAPEPFPVRFFGVRDSPIAAAADPTEPPSPIERTTRT
jgi:hypothetical protein